MGGRGVRHLGPGGHKVGTLAASPRVTTRKRPGNKHLWYRPALMVAGGGRGSAALFAAVAVTVAAAVIPAASGAESPARQAAELREREARLAKQQRAAE